MADLNLPADLTAFLQAGQPLRYDRGKCEAGTITLTPLNQLSLKYFPMVSESWKNPHLDDGGCYLVKGVSLIATCQDSSPEGLLLWLPLDERYGIWDGDHLKLSVFGTHVDWSKISANIPHHINAAWGAENSAKVTELAPWHHHPFNPLHVRRPLAALDEWYKADWVRLGSHSKELRIRLEIDGDRREVIWQVKPSTAQAQWSAPETRVPTSDELQVFMSLVQASFWEEPSSAPDQGETETMWFVSGLRAEMYHAVDRSYAKGRAEGDAIHELGKALSRLTNLPKFAR